MAHPLSLDLRQRIVEARARGLSYAEIAERLSIGLASVSRVLRRARENRGLEPDPHGGGNPPIIPQEQYPLVAALVAEAPDRTVQEVCDIWFERTGVLVSRSSMQRVMYRLKLTWKKNNSPQASNSKKVSKSSG